MALDFLSIPPSYHSLAIQRIPLRTDIVPAVPMKTLVPSKSKLNSIEAKRIVSVLDEAIAKIDLITLMSYLESHPEALEGTMPEDLVRAIREHLDIGQTLVEKASILQRKQKKVEEEEEAEEAWNRERLLSIELHKTSLWPLTHQFRDSTKTILRLLLTEPQLARLLQEQAPGRSPGAQCLLDGLVELRSFLFEKLLTSPMEVREKNQFIQDISRRSERNQEVIDGLQAELANVLKNKESEVYLPSIPQVREETAPEQANPLGLEFSLMGSNSFPFIYPSGRILSILLGGVSVGKPNLQSSVRDKDRALARDGPRELNSGQKDQEQCH